MIARILGHNFDIQFDPSSKLNKAHQEERSAERCLANNNFEGAAKHFKLAEGLLEEVLEASTNKNMIQSLQLQVGRMKMQSLIIKRKREEAETKKWFLEEQKKLDEQRKLCETKSLEEILKVQSLASTEGSTEFVSEEIPNKEISVIPQVTNDIHTASSSCHKGKEEKDCNWKESPKGKDAEELLDCLRQNSVYESGNTQYSLSTIMNFFGGWSSSVDSHPCQQNEQSPTHEDQKGQYIRKLEQQNAELCDHIKQLFNNLKSCEDENVLLKDRVRILEQRLGEEGATNNYKDGIDIAFSNDHFELDFGTPVNSLPSLEPLDLPEFWGESSDPAMKDVIDIT